MKTCIECLFDKPLDSFYKHFAMTDGYLNKCKDCVKARVKRHRELNKEKIKAYDRQRSRTKERLEAAKLASRKVRADKKPHLKNWYLKNKDKKLAHVKVQRAIAKGIIKKGPCEICGEVKSEGHHSDYTKPLEVKWLCRKHHAEVHRKYQD